MKNIFTETSKKKQRVSLSELEEIYSLMLKMATKTPAEKEDEATQKLIRKDPKSKPPRKDLRKNRVNMTEDPDLDGVGRGDDGDPDLSRRSQKLSQRVAHRYLTER
jgi:hypothetical protein